MGCVRVLCFLSALICVTSHVYIFVCIAVVYTCLCVYLWGIHTQPHYWLDLGTWRCSSLASGRLLDLAAPSNQHSNSCLPENLTYRLVSAEWLFVCLLTFIQITRSCFLPPIPVVFALQCHFVHEGWLDPVPFSFFQTNPTGLLCRENQFSGSFPIVFSAYQS